MLKYKQKYIRERVLKVKPQGLWYPGHHSMAITDIHNFTNRIEKIYITKIFDNNIIIYYYIPLLKFYKAYQ